MLIETFTPNLKELAEECRLIAQTNGFDAPNWDTAVVKIAYVMTEIDEAIDAIKLDTDDSFEEELADIAIRLLDLLNGMYGNHWNDRAKSRLNLRRKYKFQSIETLMNPVFSQCAKAIECWRKNNSTDMKVCLEIALKETFKVADLLEVDLLEEIQTKNEKNRKRGHLHGKANPRA